MDLALAFKHSLSKGTRRRTKVLGVSLTSFSYSAKGYTDEIWTESVFPALLEVYRRRKIEISIIVFRGGDRESDLGLSTALYDRMRELDAARVRIVPYSHDVQKMFLKIFECDCFIATRYHSAVLAYLAGCSFQIIPYHDKLIDFANCIQLPQKAMLPISLRTEYTEHFLRLLEESERYRPSMPLREAVKLANVNFRWIVD
jgi:polysaccharide pyruvyl transferase WcaK-like protein